MNKLFRAGLPHGWLGLGLSGLLIATALGRPGTAAARTSAIGPAVSTASAALGWLGDQPSARYRVTARGFRVERQSADDMLERDGRGDELYVRGEVFIVQANGDARFGGPPARTARLQGGTGTGGLSAQPEGGFVTGDTYPTADPTEERSGGPRPDDLPLVIWEGDLSERAEAVIIVPSIWEWDGEGASREELRWDNLLGTEIEARRAEVSPLIESWPASQSTPLFRNLFSLAIGDDGTRPIGSSQTGGSAMRIPALVLTYHSAHAAANSTVSIAEERETAPGAILFSDGNLPRGVVPVAFVDRDGLEGNYVLFLYVECVDRCG